MIFSVEEEVFVNKDNNGSYTGEYSRFRLFNFIISQVLERERIKKARSADAFQCTIF